RARSALGDTAEGADDHPSSVPLARNAVEQELTDSPKPVACTDQGDSFPNPSECLLTGDAESDTDGDGGIGLLTQPSDSKPEPFKVSKTRRPRKRLGNGSR
ncbi:hypothetical protein T310_9929, partial [Rasamsonia emersonii CBS 393.64]